MKEPIIDSSGNIFSDLGFDPAAAAILQMRAKLMNAVISSPKTATRARWRLPLPRHILPCRREDLN